MIGQAGALHIHQVMEKWLGQPLTDILIGEWVEKGEDKTRKAADLLMSITGKSFEFIEEA